MKKLWVIVMLLFPIVFGLGRSGRAELVEWSNNGHLYEVLIDTEATWDQAKAQAEALGGHLVTITSAEEQEFIEYLLVTSSAQTGAYWIGLIETTTEGIYTWDNGESLSYVNWYPGQPDNALGQFGGENRGHIVWAVEPEASHFANRGKWNDLRAEGWDINPFGDYPDLNRGGYIVEFEGDITPCYTQQQVDEIVAQAVTEAVAAKEATIFNLQQTVSSLNVTIDQQNQTIVQLNTSIYERDQIIDELNETIATMYTEEEVEQAIEDACPVKSDHRWKHKFPWKRNPPGKPRRVFKHSLWK